MTASTGCHRQKSGAVDLFFYEELDAAARERMSDHLRECGECATALDELRMIREALAARPDVSAPPSGDWSAFMRQLDAAIAREVARDVGRNVVGRNVASGLSRTGRVVRLTSGVRLKPDATPATPARTRSYIGLLATAALLAIVTIGVSFVARGRSSYLGQPTDVLGSAGDATPVATTGLTSVGDQHFERSKLVVLGLAAKEPADTPVADWAYERELATSLLKDTRLYRLAAEERGLTSLAGVMRDLELVLLETSMAEESDKAALGQIQRLIRTRGLIEKMDTAATVGM